MSDFELRSHNLRVAYESCERHARFHFRGASEALSEGKWEEFITKCNSAHWWWQRADDTKAMWFASLLEEALEAA